ncbi:hypothetical protein PMIN04_008526 [Paraphaeosphaeria minitans]
MSLQPRLDSPLRSLLSGGRWGDGQGRGRSNGAEAGGRTERQIAIIIGPWTGRSERSEVVGEVRTWRRLRVRPARSPDCLLSRTMGDGAPWQQQQQQQDLKRCWARLSSSARWRVGDSR